MINGIYILIKTRSKVKTMKNAAIMKTLIVATLFLVGIFSPAGLMASAPLNGETIYQKTLNAYHHIKSYSYINYQGEYNLFSKEAEEGAKENYGAFAKGFGYNHEDYYDQNGFIKNDRNNPFKDSQFKRGTYQYKFMKPFIIQMALVNSDYLPKILHKSVMTYRPDKDPAVFRFFPRASSFFSLSRSIDDESGSFLTMNWTTDLIKMQFLNENGTVRLLEKEKIDGRDCYVLEFFSLNGTKGKKTAGARLLSSGIPKDISVKIDKSLSGIAKKNFSSVKYWIDAEKFIIVKIEEYIQGHLYSSKTYKDIKINQLALKDFNPIKPSLTFFP